MTTRTQQALLDAMKSALESGRWEHLPSNYATVIRYSEEDLPTPSYIHSRNWPGETYDRHVFLSVVAGKKWSIILGNAPAPWLGRNDSTLTFRRAMEIVADPASVWSS